MSFFAFGPPSDGLPRFNTLGETDAGKTRWVQNKSADQDTVVNPENVDGTGHWEIRAYNATGSANVQYDCYHLTFDGDEETNPKVIAWTDADNNNNRYLVVPQEAVAAASWGWYAFGGHCRVNVDGTADIAKDEYLFLDTDGAGGLVSLITTTGTVETNSTVAIACEAFTSATDDDIRVFMLGQPKICDRQ
jgi:hypothetical protein